MKHKPQNIYLVKSITKEILLRGTNLNLATARAVAGDYLPQVREVKEVKGVEALAYAIYDTPIIDLQDPLQK